MSVIDGLELTDRQRNELDYHRRRAREHEALLEESFSYEVLDRPDRRWWNAYWRMYAHLGAMDLAGKQVLVVGCGFGDDALRLARLGADVSAFDLSPDSLSIARRLARREGLRVAFDEMPAEALGYESNRFDCIVARDILHHVDIPQSMREIRRVARPDALLLVNEIYTHSLSDRIRYSKLVDRVIYPRMRSFIYGNDEPYITEDERKLSEQDIRQIRQALRTCRLEEYFNCFVTRIVPDRIESLAKLDRMLLKALRPLAPYVAGRVLLAGPVTK